MNFCSDYHFLEGLLIVNYVIKVFKIVVPILLIVFGSYDMFQAVVNDKVAIAERFKSFGLRLASAAIIFLLPTIINLIFSMVANFSDFALVMDDCMKNANTAYIKQLKGIAKEEALAQINGDSEYNVTYNPDNYEVQQGSDSTSDSSSSSSRTDVEVEGEFLEIADTLWKTVYERNPSYGGSSIPVSGSTVDCSSFVSWVLYEYGYEEEFGGYQHITQQFVNTNWNEKFGWEEITIGAGEDASSKLQPGDIFVRDNGNNNGHMNIIHSVTEDGKVMAYDCGSASNWRNSGGQPIDKSRFAKSDSRAGKIIRVTPANDYSSDEDTSSDDE